MAAVLGGLFAVSIPAHAQGTVAAPQPARPAAAPTPTPIAALPGEYTVSRGDVLQTLVRNEPDVSREVLVRLDGRITVPLLGDLQAEGRTPRQIAQDVTAGLGKFMNAPLVTVAVGQSPSSRAYVIGQVGRSGEIPLTVPLTVAQALALCGGFKEFANKGSILIVGRDRQVTAFDYRKFESGKDLDQNVLLKPGDVIVVP
jgi:polysaccharide export outer membrane protein